MLNRSNSSKKNAHVVWDEDNLKQNEEIQKEYAAVRIAEPKTPYRPPLPEDSLEEDLRPLQRDEGQCGRADRAAAALLWRQHGRAPQLLTMLLPPAAAAAACSRRRAERRTHDSL
jgi:hypothetical protein